MTLSNLKTEKSLVENAEGKANNGPINSVVFDVMVAMLSENRRLTEDSSHGQDEQLQQRVLFLIGQTQEAQLGHCGEIRDNSPYYLMGRRQLWDTGADRTTVDKCAVLSGPSYNFREKLYRKKKNLKFGESYLGGNPFFLRVNFNVQPNQIRPRTTMWRQQPGSILNGKPLQGFLPVPL